MILMDDNFANIVRAVEKGRIIYAGIQKFVAFIMSVHIAEVMQILFCVVANIPIMRKPLQILFLILVTDLPPSIALGNEPGEPGILLEKPRPKKEPIILSWMWISITVNGFILSAVIIGIYIGFLIHYFEAEEMPTNRFIKARKVEWGDARVADALVKARTVAFIALVFSENIRAYISRSFNRPIWTKLCANVWMQKAILMAQISLVIAVFPPWISDKILELNGRIIWWEGWLGAFAGPVLTLILCEAYKVVTHYQIKRHQNRRAARQAEEEAQRTTKLNMEALQKQQDIVLQKLEELARAEKNRNEVAIGRAISRQSTNKAGQFTNVAPASQVPPSACLAAGGCFPMKCVLGKRY